MKRTKKSDAGELRPEYQRADFRELVRGKYADRLRKSSNVAIIDPEIANLFPNSAAVNAALRALAEIVKRGEFGRRLR